MSDTVLVDDPVRRLELARKDDSLLIPEAWSAPAVRRFLRRDALLARLSAANGGGVVSVCAPAGSGKSVLVESWVETEGLGDGVAWVSVERQERDEWRFWESVIDAVAEVDGRVGRAGPAPGSRGEVPVDRLISEVRALEKPLTLVIDDLHELRSAQALEWLERLLGRRPPQLSVVLVGREDPGLGLHRLRLTGDLTELRAPDLRFSLSETRRLLADVGIGLSPAAVARLHERCEGWAAGLRLAAISLADHPEPERFVAEFSGSERTVARYLMAEVLERQPADVRELLLRTSMLDRVSGPLADYLTGTSGSERILQQLEDSGAFVSSLDIGRSWFRYHRLFAELLQLELRRIAPASVGSLHRAIAQWQQHHGNTAAAIRHAQAGDDWILAARLFADHCVSLSLDGEMVTLRELSNAFPPDAPAEDAELALGFATIRVSDGLLAEAARFIDLAESLVDTVSAERKRRFDAQLATVVLSLARRRGDFEAVVEAMRLAEAALVTQPANDRARDDELRAAALQNLGIAELWSSRSEDARRDLEEALALARRVGRPYLEVGCLGHLAIAGGATGLSLGDGLKLAEEAVAIAEERGWADDPVSAPALAAGGVALASMGRFDEVEQWLARAGRALDPDGDPGTELIVHYARGLMRQAEGRLDDALTAFRRAQENQGRLSSEHAVTAIVQARLLQTRTRIGEIAGVRGTLADLDADERGNAWMRVAAASVDLAEGNPEHAVELLTPVVDGSAPAHDRSFAVIEALVLDAAAREQLRDHQAAEASLEHALELAEPEGIVLPFLLAPAQELLELHPRHRTKHATLLRTILDVLAGSPAAPRCDPAPLSEDLSEAELRIVRYLPTNLKAPEIAAEVCLSANTVRTHIRHIYLKLDAHDRNQAVARARSLGLLARSR